MPVKDLALEVSGVDALSRMNGESDWLREWRLGAARSFASMEYPSFKNEDWRRTDLSRLDVSGLDLHRSAPAAASVATLPPPLNTLAQGLANLLVVHNAGVAYRSVAAPGLSVLTLAEAARQMPDTLKAHLGSVVKPDETKFTALAAAAAAPGVVVHVARNADVAEPLYLFAYGEGDRTGLAQQMLIVAEPNSRLHIVEYSTSPDTADVFHTGSTEVVALPGAQVTYTVIQAWGGRTVSFVTRRALVRADARVDWHVADIGGVQVRVDQESRLVEPGGASYSLQVLAHDGDQRHDLGINMEHYAEHTDGDIKGAAVTRETCRTVLRPVGHIRLGAKGSSTFQRNNVLLLSGESRCDVMPILLIDETDVAAGHAATAGQVDDEQLFYLMSRGISKAAAMKMLVEGFLSPVVSQMALGALADELKRLLDVHMGIEH